VKFHQFAFTLAVLTVPLRASDSSPEAVRCYEWFGTLGFPDVQKAPFVRYMNGCWIDYGKGRHQPWRQGFLLEDTKERFRILTLALEEVVLTKTKPGAAESEQVCWQKMEFSDHASAVLHDLRNPAEKEDGARDRFGERLSHSAETFGIASAAWRRGLPDVSQDLFDEAVKLARVPPAGFRTQLERNLGDAAMWRAVVAAGVDLHSGLRRVSRKELVTMFENIVRRYPACEHIVRARETADMFKRMVAEDEGHPLLTNEALEKLPVAERVNEFIFQLRDVSALQLDSPGYPDIFATPKDSAANQLLAMGLDAVPGLISAMGDKRFCRSVTFWRDYCFSHRILTIGDCSLTILQCIAGKGFQERIETEKLSPAETEAATRKAVEEWWNGVKKKGIKQTLVDEISSGEVNPVLMHEKLAAIDANASILALLEGAGKSRNAWIRARFFDLLGSSADPRAVEYLLRRMREEKTAADRVAAMKAMTKTRRGDVLMALIQEWRAFRPFSSADSDYFGHHDLFESITHILAEWRSQESVNALGFQWEERSASERGEICDSLARALLPDDTNEKPGAPAEAVAAAIRILAGALEDTDGRASMSVSLGDWNSSSYPSVATIANRALHLIKPDIYAFSNKASRPLREAERLAAINTWRKSNGQPPLPIPIARVRLAPADAMQIMEVTVKAPSGKAGRQLKESAEALKGKNLEVETLPSICRDFASKETAGIAGITVKAHRDENLTGVVIRLILYEGKYPDKSGWLHSSHLTLGDETLGSSSGSGTREIVQERRGWEDEIELLGKIIKAAPETAFEVEFSVGDVKWP
jgi:hypothetical protein